MNSTVIVVVIFATAAIGSGLLFLTGIWINRFAGWIGCKISRITWRKMKFTDSQKILLMSSILTIALLLIANAPDLPAGYYTFLRICCCTVSAWLLILHRNPYWKFALGIVAILYNPLFPIHLSEKDLWTVINLMTIPVLIIAFIKALKTAAK